MGENQALAGPLCDLVILTAQHVQAHCTEPPDGDL